MIEIRPNILYSRSDLALLLDGVGVDVDTFISRIAARKVFRKLWLGADILDGLKKAPALGPIANDDESHILKARNRGNRTARNNEKMEEGPLERMARGAR